MKKKYLIPEIEVMRMNTEDVMIVSQPSDVKDQLGGGPTSAPARRVPTLGNDSVKAF